MKGRFWGGALLLVVVCAASSGCYSGLNGAAVVGGGPPPTATTQTSPTLAPINLVPNGSFELGISPWEPLQPYSRIIATRSLHRVGKLALLALPTSAEVPYFGAQVRILSNPAYNSSYWTRVWVRGGHQAPSWVRMTLFVVKPSSNGWAVVVLNTRSRPLRSGWQRFSLRGTVTSPDAAVLELQIRAERAIKRWSRLAVDGVDATAVASAPAHKPAHK